MSKMRDINWVNDNNKYVNAWFLYCKIQKIKLDKALKKQLSNTNVIKVSLLLIINTLLK